MSSLSHPAHEHSDAPWRPVIWSAVGLIVVVAISGLVAMGVFGALKYPVVTVQKAPEPPAPRIEEHPTVELRDLRQYEDSVLTTYGWVDKSKGVVRIPIDQAMEMKLRQGFVEPKAEQKGAPAK